MSDPVKQLSSELRGIMREFGLRSETLQETPFVRVYNEDGGFLLEVSTLISPDDLRALLNYGRTQFDLGFALGQKDIQAKARALFLG